MLLFLATVVEQLDLALEHVSKRDVHNARFGLMLTDNAIELVLHQIAANQANELKHYSFLRDAYPHQKALQKALGRSFQDKVRFAKIEGKLSDEVARTVNIMHGFRNEVYHIGLRHEAILSEIAVFYFSVATNYLATYEPDYFGWVLNQKLPERARKYFHGSPSFPGDMEDFGNACRSLSNANEHDPTRTITALADHMDNVIEEQDISIGIVADGVYDSQRTTRDEAIVETQAWHFAFSDEGSKFASEHGLKGSSLGYVTWLAQNYSFKVRSDPIQSWRKQAAKLRSGKSAHAALAHYHSFMSGTATLRAAIEDAARGAEAEIDAAIDRARGK